MKKIFFSIALLSVCSVALATDTGLMPSVVITNDLEIPTKSTVDAGPAIKAYLLVKDALVTGNGAAASQAGTALTETLTQLEKEMATPAERSAFSKDGKGALKGAAAIGKTEDIKVQRKAFGELSTHFYNLIKVTGTSKVLYLDYCPMAKASWLSEKKAIANPYYGTSMLSCGSVKETLEP